MRYHNYHSHSDYSNTRVIDVSVKRKHYVERAKELGHTSAFSTEHGTSGNVYELYDACKEEGLACIFGMELYLSKDHLEKKGKNWHVIAIALNHQGYRAINRISSEANINGFYRQPRVDVPLLLTLPPEDVVITTACINNPIFLPDDDFDPIGQYLLPLKEHFGNHFFIEVQSHNDHDQIKFNRVAKRLAKEHDISLIAGVDSHYIYPEQANSRTTFLTGKNFKYDLEDGFVLDYPSGEELITRFIRQGVFNESEATQLLKATHIFDKAEDLNFTNDFKTPVIHQDLTSDERLQMLKDIINEKAKVYLKKNKHLPTEEKKRRVQEIKKELDVIVETNDVVHLADYFLLNYEMIERGKTVYDGILTRTGRGSASGYFINYLLGFTSVDRFESPIPLYPSRFISSTRLIENHTVADIDFNVAEDIPFIKASKDLLGENGCYRMVAFGEMKNSSAFRNTCRAHKLDMKDYNDVGKNIDSYRSDKKWKNIIEESEQYVGVIENISPAPCSFILSNDDLREQIGVIRIGDELCANINGYWAEKYGFLKNDILNVTVWRLISDTFKMVNRPIPDITELLELVTPEVWKLYEDGMTATLNQVATDNGYRHIVRYKPKNLAELSAFVAAVRPAFASLLDNFLKRNSYTTGVAEIDKVLEPSYHYMLYQESIMQVLNLLGIEESGTYDIIKKISKKKLTEDEIEDLHQTLEKNFIELTGSTQGFNDVWQVMNDAAAYAFNSAHSICVALDSLYGAYLKYNYPLEYYTVCFNTYAKDLDITAKLTKELSYFDIALSSPKFPLSRGEYSFDRETRTIAKGIGSVKNMNVNVADDIYKLKDEKFDGLFDLFSKMTKIGVTKTKMETLLAINFFSEFGKNQKLLSCYSLFHAYRRRASFNKSNLPMDIPEDAIARYAGSETEKVYHDMDMPALLEHVFSQISDENVPLKQQIKLEESLIGVISLRIPNDKKMHYIMDAKRPFKNGNVTAKIYDLNNGAISDVKIKAKVFDANPIKKGDFIYVGWIKEDYKWKKVNPAENNGRSFIQVDETEEILASYTITQEVAS